MMGEERGSGFAASRCLFSLPRVSRRAVIRFVSGDADVDAVVVVGGRIVVVVVAVVVGVDEAGGGIGW